MCQASWAGLLFQDSKEVPILLPWQVSSKKFAMGPQASCIGILFQGNFLSSLSYLIPLLPLTRNLVSSLVLGVS